MHVLSPVRSPSGLICLAGELGSSHGKDKQSNDCVYGRYHTSRGMNTRLWLRNTRSEFRLHFPSDIVHTSRLIAACMLLEFSLDSWINHSSSRILRSIRRVQTNCLHENVNACPTVYLIRKTTDCVAAEHVVHHVPEVEGVNGCSGIMSQNVIMEKAMHLTGWQRCRCCI